MYNKYRVYDNQTKEWVTDNVYESPVGDLWQAKKGLFGGYKFELLSDTRYTRQRCTGLTDMNKFMIYEGDICETTDGLCDENGNDVKGVVSYTSECAQYFLYDVRFDKYYPIGDEVCELLKIIGNVKASPEFLTDDTVEEVVEEDNSVEVQQEATECSVEETGD